MLLRLELQDQTLFEIDELEEHLLNFLEAELVHHNVQTLNVGDKDIHQLEWPVSLVVYLVNDRGLLDQDRMKYLANLICDMRSFNV